MSPSFFILSQSGFSTCCSVRRHSPLLSLSLLLLCITQPSQEGILQNRLTAGENGCERTKYDGPFNLRNTMDAHSHPFNLVLKQYCCGSVIRLHCSQPLVKQCHRCSTLQMETSTKNTCGNLDSQSCHLKCIA
jgi:hypothetical protein